jgi:alpha-1,3-rhamnosyl/mannosyltransferase
MSVENKPKVIVDGRRLTPQSTGVGRYLSLLLDHWAEAAETLPFEPVVILHTDRPKRFDPWKDTFEHHVVGQNSPGWVWENFYLAKSHWRKSVLFAPANLVPRRWIGPVVLVIHDTFCEHPDAKIPMSAKLRFRSRYRRSAHRADLILTPSQSTADDVRDLFRISENRTRVVRPGLPKLFYDVPGPIPPEITAQIDSAFLLFVGKTSARREFPKIVAAVEQIARTESPVKLVRVGPPSAHKIESPVLLDLGHVSDNVLKSLYRKALALVWPSAREGFGLPVLEAMALGCAVITNPDHALGELCQGVCEPLRGTSQESILRAIRRLLDDKELRNDLALRGIERSKQFDAQRFSSETAHAIASLAVQSSNHHR